MSFFNDTMNKEVKMRLLRQQRQRQQAGEGAPAAQQAAPPPAPLPRDRVREEAPAQQLQAPVPDRSFAMRQAAAGIPQVVQIRSDGQLLGGVGSQLSGSAKVNFLQLPSEAAAAPQNSVLDALYKNVQAREKRSFQMQSAPENSKSRRLFQAFVGAKGELATPEDATALLRDLAEDKDRPWYVFSAADALQGRPLSTLKDDEVKRYVRDLLHLASGGVRAPLPEEVEVEIEEEVGGGGEETDDEDEAGGGAPVPVYDADKAEAEALQFLGKLVNTDAGVYGELSRSGLIGEASRQVEEYLVNKRAGSTNFAMASADVCMEFAMEINKHLKDVFTIAGDATQNIHLIKEPYTTDLLWNLVLALFQPRMALRRELGRDLVPGDEVDVAKMLSAAQESLVSLFATIVGVQVLEMQGLETQKDALVFPLDRAFGKGSAWKGRDILSLHMWCCHANRIMTDVTGAHYLTREPLMLTRIMLSCLSSAKPPYMRNGSGRLDPFGTYPGAAMLQAQAPLFLFRDAAARASRAAQEKALRELLSVVQWVSGIREIHKPNEEEWKHLRAGIGYALEDIVASYMPVDVTAQVREFEALPEERRVLAIAKLANTVGGTGFARETYGFADAVREAAAGQLPTAPVPTFPFDPLDPSVFSFAPSSSSSTSSSPTSTTSMSTTSSFPPALPRAPVPSSSPSLTAKMVEDNAEASRRAATAVAEADRLAGLVETLQKQVDAVEERERASRAASDQALRKLQEDKDGVQARALRLESEIGRLERELLTARSATTAAATPSTRSPPRDVGPIAETQKMESVLGIVPENADDPIYPRLHRAIIAMEKVVADRNRLAAEEQRLRDRLVELDGRIQELTVREEAHRAQMSSGSAALDAQLRELRAQLEEDTRRQLEEARRLGAQDLLAKEEELARVRTAYETTRGISENMSTLMNEQNAHQRQLEQTMSAISRLVEGLSTRDMQNTLSRMASARTDVGASAPFASQLAERYAEVMTNDTGYLMQYLRTFETQLTALRRALNSGLGRGGSSTPLPQGAATPGSVDSVIVRMPGPIPMTPDEEAAGRSMFSSPSPSDSSASETELLVRGPSTSGKRLVTPLGPDSRMGMKSPSLTGMKAPVTQLFRPLQGHKVPKSSAERAEETEEEEEETEEEESAADSSTSPSSIGSSELNAFLDKEISRKDKLPPLPAPAAAGKKKKPTTGPLFSKSVKQATTTAKRSAPSSSAPTSSFSAPTASSGAKGPKAPLVEETPAASYVNAVNGEMASLNRLLVQGDAIEKAGGLPQWASAYFPEVNPTEGGGVHRAQFHQAVGEGLTFKPSQVSKGNAFVNTAVHSLAAVMNRCPTLLYGKFWSKKDQRVAGRSLYLTVLLLLKAAAELEGLADSALADAVGTERTTLESSVKTLCTAMRRVLALDTWLATYRSRRDLWESMPNEKAWNDKKLGVKNTCISMIRGLAEVHRILSTAPKANTACIQQILRDQEDVARAAIREVKPVEDYQKYNSANSKAIYQTFHDWAITALETIARGEDASELVLQKGGGPHWGDSREHEEAMRALASCANAGDHQGAMAYAGALMGMDRDEAPEDFGHALAALRTTLAHHEENPEAQGWLPMLSNLHGLYKASGSTPPTAAAPPATPAIPSPPSRDSFLVY
jgi:hypothetical protein